MKIRIVSFTVHGEQTARRVKDALASAGHACRPFAPESLCKPGDEPLSVPVSDWAGDGFQNADALVFVCAAGIAVRAIAPWVRDKTTDPAVLVLDEKGTYVIPLLSGHLGGANALANALSAAIGATAVVTTATDLNGLFAVDVFAKNNHLFIADMEAAKAVSAALLRGEPVGFRSDFLVRGTLPKGLTRDDAPIGIYITQTEQTPFARTLRLIPKRYALGAGCRRNKRADALEAFFRRELHAAGVPVSALRCIASIDLKRDEPGLSAVANAFGVPFETFTRDELNAVIGTFSQSAFVRETTGVDCVSERAAVRASQGELVVKKVAEDGMTFALAVYGEEIAFE